MGWHSVSGGPHVTLASSGDVVAKGPSKIASGCVLPPSAQQQARGRKDDCDDTRTIVNLFDDGVFYRCGFIIQAEHNRKRHEKCRGTLWHEVVHFSEQVYIVGLVLLDSALDFGSICC